MLGRSEVDVEELRGDRNEHSTTTTGTTDHSSYMYPRPGQLQQLAWPIACSGSVAHVQQSGRQHSTHAANTPV
jgi:hypothetical protein